MRYMICFSFALFMPVISMAATLHVPGDYSYIQAGIDAAVDGDIVLVAPGTYQENIDFLGKSITLKSSDGPALTVIDGGNPTDDDYKSVVLFNKGEDADSVLEGFTLKNGLGTLYEYGNVYYGGGIFCKDSSPKITGNIIQGNNAGQGGGGICCFYSNAILINNKIIGNVAGNVGGGILSSHSSLTIHDSIIENNTLEEPGSRGGGIYSYDSTSSITDCSIRSNLSLGEGGGSYFCEYDTSILSKCVISFNITEFGGGISCWRSSPVITYNSILENVAEVKGGGIHCNNNSNPVIKFNDLIKNQSGDGGGILCNASSPEVRSNLFSGNSALRGGAITCWNSSPPTSTPEISKNIIVDNLAEEQGGGICCWINTRPLITDNYISNNSTQTDGGGIYCTQSMSTILNNTIKGNSAEIGGGISCYSCSPDIVNNIIACNLADWGGGVDCIDLASPMMTNNTIVGNTAVYEGGGIYSRGFSIPNVANSILWNNIATTGAQIGIGVDGDPSFLWISYSDVQGGEEAVSVHMHSKIFWIEGMIDMDPLFVDADNDDYHLTYHSPCRGTGDNYANELPVMDWEGDPRIHEGTTDLGADEFHRHFYCTGSFKPEQTIAGKFIADPGTEPVGLFYGTAVLEFPVNTMWGAFYLDSPWFFTGSLGVIPVGGVFELSAILPEALGPYDVPLQAFIGDQLSNHFVIQVK